MTWMNLPEEYRKGRFVILPIEYEQDVSYGTGAGKGPAEIIKASQQLEYYDEQFGNEPFLQGIELLEPIRSDSPEEMIEKVINTVSKQKKQFILSLGGDHAITIGVVKALEQIHDDFSVIILDAHADFRDSWNGSQYNHACVAKQAGKNHDLLLVGVRSMDIDEKETIHNNSNVSLIPAYDYSLEKIKASLPKLKQKIYLSIDVDVFDLAFIRNAGTPEPGGFTWNQVMEILKLIFQKKEVIAADIVEFAPENNFRAEAYSLAKLAYKMMALASKEQENL